MDDEGRDAFERLEELFWRDGRQFSEQHEVPRSIVGAALIGAGLKLFEHGPAELALWFEHQARQLRASLGRSGELQ